MSAIPLLALLAFAPAQEVQGEARFEPAAAPAGSLAELHVRLHVRSGWHVYSPDQEASSGIPLSFQVQGDGLRLVGPPHGLDQPRRVEEKIGSTTEVLLELFGSPEFVLPVWVEGDPGQVQAQVRVRYQVCDASSCKPPANLDLTADLERTAAAPAADTGHAAPGSQGEVQWSASLEPAEAQSGQTVLLRLHAEAEPGWHLYHPLMDPQWGLPVTVQSLGGALRPAEHSYLHAPGTVRLHEDQFGQTKAYSLWLGGALDFTLPVQVDGEPGAASGEIRIDWQTCNDQLCNPQQQTPLQVPLTLLAGGTRLPTASGADPVQPPLEGSAQPAADGTAPPAPDPSEEPAGTSGAQPADAGQLESEAQQALGQGLFAFLLTAMAAALFSLATPCVFPMIPITVSFFTKRAEAGKGRPLPNALAYGLGIVLTFVGLGLGITAAFGAGGVNGFASSPYLNLALGALFVVFAFSLLGLYDINPPRWLQARLSAATASGQQKSGYGPVMLMAVAFSVTAFTCTVAFVGGVLVLAATGAWFYALLGMTAYALVFATPFVLLALFPSALRRLPQAGGWMEDVKVAMGFLELIFALKFFSNADLHWDAELLTRPVIIALTALPIVMWAFCLFRVFRTPHEFEYTRPGWRRVALGVLALAAGGYVLNGLRGGGYAGALEGYFPPRSYGVRLVGAATDAAHEGKSVQLGPADLPWYQDYAEAFARAKELGKPLFLDFTGVTCINCRRMEANILPAPPVKTLLEQCVRAELWVDKAPYGDWNKKFQEERFHTVQQPQYVVMDARSDRVLAVLPKGYLPDPAVFASLVQAGLDAMPR